MWSHETTQILRADTVSGVEGSGHLVRWTYQRMTEDRQAARDKHRAVKQRTLPTNSK